MSWNRRKSKRTNEAAGHGVAAMFMPPFLAFGRALTLPTRPSPCAGVPLGTPGSSLAPFLLSCFSEEEEEPGWSLPGESKTRKSFLRGALV